MPPPFNRFRNRMDEGCRDVDEDLPKMFGVDGLESFGNPLDVLCVPMKLHGFEFRGVGKVERRWRRRYACIHERW